MRPANAKIKTTPKKAALYKTARAVISCAYFQRGDHVAVKYDRTDGDGCLWFAVTSNGETTYYPEHHLTDFVL